MHTRPFIVCRDSVKITCVIAARQCSRSGELRLSKFGDWHGGGMTKVLTDYGSLIQDRCDGLNQDHPRLAGCL
jgi:hypothetical protein